MQVRNFSPVFRNKVVFPDFNSISNEWRHFQEGHFATQPAINIVESAMEIKIDVAAPGLTKEDFSIVIESEKLIVSANMAHSDEQKQNEKPIMKGFSFNNFQKVFNLNEDVQREEVYATYENGVLSIVLSKKPKAEPMKIIIR